MEKEVEALKTSLYKMCWFMRGGVSIEQLFNMDLKDHDLMTKIIKENLETTKESGLPFF